MSEKKSTMTVSMSIEYRDIMNTLVGAFEGGSNYWLKSVYWGAELRKIHEESPWKNEPFGSVYSDVMAWALQQGENFCAQIDDYEGDYNNLNPASIKRGVQTMHDKFRRHYDDMVNENDDSTTSDVLLQCILYNDVIFG